MVRILKRFSYGEIRYVAVMAWLLRSLAVRLPQVLGAAWRETARSTHVGSNGFPYSFVTLDRK